MIDIGEEFECLSRVVDSKMRGRDVVVVVVLEPIAVMEKVGK